MKTSTNILLGASLTLVLCPAAAWAQQASQSSSPSAAQQNMATKAQKAKPAAAKSAKVWTEDDIASVRTPADDYMDVERAQTQAAAAADAATKQKQTAATKPPQNGAPPALSNPKTAEDADKMIAWEQKDANAQQQFVDQLRQQLDAAPPDQKERLQKQLQEHIDNLAVTQKELQTVTAQKEALEKKPAPSSGSTKQPQSQQ